MLIIVNHQTSACDLIFIGRSLIGDPDWGAKMRDGWGAEIRPFRRTGLEWLT
jgi:2,4-dienoyl-CoA reductase-like NADH-dependent reductase (Old Yellow Enzyme family)